MDIKTKSISITDETLDELGVMFVNGKVLDKHGISFITFIEEWKLGKLEQYI